MLNGNNYNDCQFFRSVSSIWGNGPTDVFAIRSIYDGTILHYDGQSWTDAYSSDSTQFYDIWGSDSKNVFVVGTDYFNSSENIVLHYDGQNWTTLYSDDNSGDDNSYDQFHGIWGSSPIDIFAVRNRGGILHYDGQNWTPMDSNNSSPLYDIWGSGPNDVFAIGDSIILHYDGQSWTSMNDSFNYSYGNFNYLSSVWGSGPTDVFAIGWGDIYHYDGNSWMEVFRSNYDYNDIWGTAPDDVFAVGDLIFHLDEPISHNCPDCQLQITPASHNFWTVPIDQTASQTFTLSNTSDSEIQLSPLTLAHPQFILENDTCSDITLNPADTCQITVTFQPQNESTQTTELIVASPTANTLTVPLSGNGCAYQQQLSLRPEQPDFGTVLVNETAYFGQTIFFQSCGEAVQIEAESIQLAGEHADEFSIQNAQCYHSGWNQETYTYCQLALYFNPTSEGDKHAELTFTLDNEAISTSPVPLQAKAVLAGEPKLTLTPTDHNFGAITLNSSSQPQTFTLHNNGLVSANLNEIITTGADAADFSLESWDCLRRSALYPDASCQINVIFSPNTLGEKQAQLQVAGMEQTVLLSGISEAPKDCADDQITLETIQSGAWHDPAIWNTNQLPTRTDIVRINSGHTVTGLAQAQLRTLCIQAGAVLESPNNQGSSLEIQLSDYLENKGTIRGQDGAHQSSEATTCTTLTAVGTPGCAQPGASVIIKVSRQFNDSNGGPILNTGEIIAGRGGDGIQYAAPGGDAIVLGRNTTNTHLIQAGHGGHVIGDSSGQAGSGGTTQIWGSFGGAGNFYNRTGAQVLAGHGGHCNNGDQIGGDGGDIRLIAWPGLFIDDGIIEAGQGGKTNCATPGSGGTINIDPNIISLAGTTTQISGGDIAIYGGDNWTLDLSHLNNDAITATGNITLAVGEGGIINLEGSQGTLLKAEGEVKLFANDIRLAAEHTLSDYIQADNIVVGPSKVLYAMSLTAPAKIQGRAGAIKPIHLTLTNDGPEVDTYHFSFAGTTGYTIPSTTLNGLTATTMALAATLPALGEVQTLNITATSSADQAVTKTVAVQLVAIDDSQDTLTQTDWLNNVHLAADAQVKGGQLSGQIQGDSVSPALLEDLVLAPDSQVDNVIIGKEVTWDKTIHWGENVIFQQCETDRLSAQSLPLPPLSNYDCVQINGGIALTDSGAFAQQLTVLLANVVAVQAQIAVAPQDWYQPADIVVYAAYRPLGAENVGPQYFMLDEQGNVLSWDEQPEHLVAFVSETPLTEVIPITLYQGQFLATGQLEVYLGYRLPNGDMKVNQQAIIVEINN